jgi:hypothetical protein
MFAAAVTYSDQKASIFILFIAFLSLRCGADCVLICGKYLNPNFEKGSHLLFDVILS